MYPHDPRQVTILLDEIYVEHKTMYKGGCLTGMSGQQYAKWTGQHSTDFMMCSLLSANKDVAATVLLIWLQSIWKSGHWKLLKC